MTLKKKREVTITSYIGPACIPFKCLCRFRRFESHFCWTSVQQNECSDYSCMIKWQNSEYFFMYVSYFNDRQYTSRILSIVINLVDIKCFTLILFWEKKEKRKNEKPIYNCLCARTAHCMCGSCLCRAVIFYWCASGASWYLIGSSVGVCDHSLDRWKPSLAGAHRGGPLARTLQSSLLPVASAGVII